MYIPLIELCIFEMIPSQIRATMWGKSSLTVTGPWTKILETISV